LQADTACSLMRLPLIGQPHRQFASADSQKIQQLLREIVLRDNIC